jgi:hypothetical protein
MATLADYILMTVEVGSDTVGSDALQQRLYDRGMGKRDRFVYVGQSAHGYHVGDFGVAEC